CGGVTSQFCRPWPRGVSATRVLACRGEVLRRSISLPAMIFRQWHRSPAVLKLLVGQHIVNGLSVAAGVAAVTIAASLVFGFAAGQPATLGAIAASIGDFPAPFRNKAATLAVGFSLAVCATLIVLLVEGHAAALIVAIGVIAFVAGLVSGLGRWALALSMQMLIPVVFILSLPPMGL